MSSFTDTELKHKIGQLMATIKLLCNSPQSTVQQVASCLAEDHSFVENNEKLDGILKENMSILTNERRPPTGI